MNSSVYFIYSPTADQSLVIAGLLRKYFPSANIVGVVFHDEEILISRGNYNRIIKIDAIDTELTNELKIPTGAVSTKYFLEKGDIKLGAVTLTQEMLHVFDKPWLISQAAAAGVPVPTTWQQVEEVDSYPMFYKQRYEQGGGVRGIARTSHNVPTQEQDSFIFQEFIDNPGTYGVGFLADKGRLLATHTHFEHESIPKEGGSAVFIERFEDLRLLEHTQRLVKWLDYSGWGLAEFKYCPRRNNYVFMEINAKFWASCELAFVNEPLFLKLLFGIESIEKPIERIFFVERAFSRGWIFVMQNIHYLFDRGDIRVYSGWLYRLIYRAIPMKLRQLLKIMLIRNLKKMLNIKECS